MPKRFVLIDAHSIIYRSYFAFIRNPLKNRKGETTSGIFGFMNTLDKIKQSLGFELVGLVYDAPGKTFRDEIFKEYKATRQPTPPDLPFQIDKVKEICRHMGIAGFELAGYEADDILATIATRFQNQGEVFIVTSDKDLMQLVNDRIFIYDAYKNLIYDKDMVLKKFGVLPERIVEYLALVGDTIDNVPGVPGIGPKRAAEILKKYSGLDQALAREERLAGKQELIELSRRLLHLDQDVPINVSVDDLSVKPVNMAKLAPVLTELEFHSFMRSLAPNRTGTKTRIIDDQPICIPDQAAFGVYIESLSGPAYVAVSENEVYRTMPERIDELLNNPDHVKIGYDFKQMLRLRSIEAPYFDLRIVAWLLDPNRKTYSLEDIVNQYLQEYGEIDPPDSAHFVYRLYARLNPLLQAQNQESVYWSIEAPLIRVLRNIESRGIRTDAQYLTDMGREINQNLQQYEKKIFEHAGMNFNIGSPKQLARVLFEEIKLSPVRKTKTGFSTDGEVLEQLGKAHPLPALILKYRELAKLRSTYVEPLLDLAWQGRIRTTFNQTGTATGRLSSINPNLQNIPIRSEIGRRFRGAFVAEKGNCLISADYSQIELRILAHITGDKNLINAFRENKDIHAHTASLVFNIDESRIDDEQRRMAKVVNYGLIYGMSDYGLAQGLDISREKALEFIQSYYNLYPGVAGWREQAVEFAEKNGYSETMFGRRRPLPDIKSDNHARREFTKRAAINTPIQGTAADIMKKAMIAAEAAMLAHRLVPGLILSIHDELLFEVHEKDREQAMEIIEKAMINVVEMAIPLKISIHAGPNWAQIH